METRARKNWGRWRLLFAYGRAVGSRSFRRSVGRSVGRSVSRRSVDRSVVRRSLYVVERERKSENSRFLNLNLSNFP